MSHINTAIITTGNQFSITPVNRHKSDTAHTLTLHNGEKVEIKEKALKHVSRHSLPYDFQQNIGPGQHVYSFIKNGDIHYVVRPKDGGSLLYLGADTDHTLTLSNGHRYHVGSQELQEVSGSKLPKTISVPPDTTVLAYRRNATTTHYFAVNNETNQLEHIGTKRIHVIRVNNKKIKLHPSRLVREHTQQLPKDLQKQHPPVYSYYKAGTLYYCTYDRSHEKYYCCGSEKAALVKLGGNSIIRIRPSCFEDITLSEPALGVIKLKKGDPLTIDLSGLKMISPEDAKKYGAKSHQSMYMYYENPDTIHIFCYDNKHKDLHHVKTHILDKAEKTTHTEIPAPFHAPAETLPEVVITLTHIYLDYTDTLNTLHTLLEKMKSSMDVIPSYSEKDHINYSMATTLTKEVTEKLDEIKTTLATLLKQLHENTELLETTPLSHTMITEIDTLINLCDTFHMDAKTKIDDLTIGLEYLGKGTEKLKKAIVGLFGQQSKDLTEECNYYFSLVDFSLENKENKETVKTLLEKYKTLEKQYTTHIQPLLTEKQCTIAEKKLNALRSQLVSFLYPDKKPEKIITINRPIISCCGSPECEGKLLTFGFGKIETEERVTKKPTYGASKYSLCGVTYIPWVIKLDSGNRAFVLMPNETAYDENPHLPVFVLWEGNPKVHKQDAYSISIKKLVDANEEMLKEAIQMAISLQESSGEKNITNYGGKSSK